MQIEIISNMPKKVNLKALKIYADALLNASDIDDIENLYSLCSYELRQIYLKNRLCAPSTNRGTKKV